MLNVVTHMQSTVDRAKRRLTGSARDTPAPVIDTYPSLSAPLVTLYVTPEQRDASLEAFDVLAESRTGFSVERAADNQVAAEFGGQLQVGIEEIRGLRDALLQFERDFLHSNYALTSMIDPMRDEDVKRLAEAELADQIEQAEAQLKCALA